MARSKAEALPAARQGRKPQAAPGHVPFLHQHVARPDPQRRSAEGASTGRSAKSTAGGAAGQLTAKD
jgi:hypothetical protein